MSWINFYFPSTWFLVLSFISVDFSHLWLFFTRRLYFVCEEYFGWFLFYGHLTALFSWSSQVKFYFSSVHNVTWLLVKVQWSREEVKKKKKKKKFFRTFLPSKSTTVWKCTNCTTTRRLIWYTHKCQM